jgi:hypothetical protein
VLAVHLFIFKRTMESLTPNKSAAGNSRCLFQLRLIYEIVRHTFISTSRSAAVPELWTLDGRELYDHSSAKYRAAHALEICPLERYCAGRINYFRPHVFWRSILRPRSWLARRIDWSRLRRCMLLGFCGLSPQPSACEVGCLHIAFTRTCYRF